MHSLNVPIDDELYVRIEALSERVRVQPARTDRPERSAFLSELGRIAIRGLVECAEADDEVFFYGLPSLADAVFKTNKEV